MERAGRRQRRQALPSGGVLPRALRNLLSFGFLISPFRLPSLKGALPGVCMDTLSLKAGNRAGWRGPPKHPAAAAHQQRGGPAPSSPREQLGWRRPGQGTRKGCPRCFGRRWTEEGWPGGDTVLSVATITARWLLVPDTWHMRTAPNPEQPQRRQFSQALLKPPCPRNGSCYAKRRWASPEGLLRRPLPRGFGNWPPAETKFLTQPCFPPTPLKQPEPLHS